MTHGGPASEGTQGAAGEVFGILSGCPRPWCLGGGWSQASEGRSKSLKERKKGSASQEGRVTKGLRPKVM